MVMRVLASLAISRKAAKDAKPQKKRYANYYDLLWYLINYSPE